MQAVDQGIESKEILIAEIDTLMRRLILTEIDALTMLESLFQKLRVERAVERHYN